MNAEQKRKIEEARKESLEKTTNVCADGEKRLSNEYSEFGNCINNE